VSAPLPAPLTVVGIDPGVTGAIAVLRDRHFLAVHDMPVITSSAGKRLPCAHSVAGLLRDAKPDLVVIEQVNSRPAIDPKTRKPRKMGTQSMFNFGRGLGLVESAALIEQLRVCYVAPAAWKRKASLINTHKDTARLLARELWSEAQDELRRKKDHGRADALLIARFGHGFW
jgi:crossover junction endodeoxyribonuclease RuvC